MSVAPILDRARDAQRALREERHAAFRSAPVPFVQKPRHGWLDLENEVTEMFGELASHVDVFDVGMRVFSDDCSRARRWYRENRRRALAYAKTYARSHRAEINEYKREHRTANINTERAKERVREERAKPVRRKVRRARYRKNPEKYLRPMREAYQAGKGAARQATRNAKATGKCCAWKPCGKPVQVPERGVIPEFCGRRCRDAATRAGQWKGRKAKGST